MDGRSTELTLFLFILAAAVSATDHIVGANKEWNPGVNYTSWATNTTFYVGDLISFRYQKNMYNVFQVNATGYDNCTTEGSLGNWTSGKDFIPLDTAKRYYFIGGNGQCFNGMKVTVLVQALPSPPGGARPANQSSSGQRVRGDGGFMGLKPNIVVAVFGALMMSIGSGFL